MNHANNQHAVHNFSNQDRHHTKNPNLHFTLAHSNSHNNKFHKNFNPKNPQSNAISEVHGNQNAHKNRRQHDYQEFSRMNYQMYVT